MNKEHDDDNVIPFKLQKSMGLRYRSSGISLESLTVKIFQHDSNDAYGSSCCGYDDLMKGRFHSTAFIRFLSLCVTLYMGEIDILHAF